MSYQKSQQPRKILTQKQSSIFDNLNWSEEKEKWFETKAGKSYPKRWKECMFADAPTEAIQIFDELEVAEKEKVLSFSLIYLYGKGRDRFFQSKASAGGGSFSSASASPTTSTTTSNIEGQEDKWEKIHARQEERDKAFQERHNELVKKIDDLNFNIVDLTSVMRELLREEKEKRQ